ncbi:hypothetical protein TH25_24910 [Thalassospira profundimaris]|uniref:IclR family transcriptional regulator n=1 Tax=Thalassospira profundimaris TaxID=502049 RepID=A0A367WFD0_9PROT|nr:IclR family transcriptional regulator [Thalassospira profundimaris]RCK40175.1 hypothetical protein TH25_24910 [Thalassospira profundimaris]
MSSMNPDNEDRYIVPGLLRGLQILQCFSRERTRLSLSEIARMLDLSRSSVFRSAYTLAQAGYLVHDQRNKTYALGPAVLRLGQSYPGTRELIESAFPTLEELRDQTGWSAHLGVLDDTDIVYLLRVPSFKGLPSIVHVGSRLPACATTMGRILLAELDEDELRTLYRNAAFPKTSSPIDSMTSLIQQWRKDRGAAIIQHFGDFESGIVSIAANIRDFSGDAVAAINLTAPSDTLSIPNRIDQKIHDQLATAAQKLSWMLGYEAN